MHRQDRFRVGSDVLFSTPYRYAWFPYPVLAFSPGQPLVGAHGISTQSQRLCRSFQA